MRTPLLLFVALISAACADSAPPAETDEAPDFETTEVAEGIYRFRFNAHNGMFVTTDAGVVAFDPISTTAAGHFADEIKRLVPGAQLAAIVYSHRDADHATGAEVLRAAFDGEAPIYAHENAAQPLRESADPDLPPPDSTFSATMSLGDGPDRIDLYYLGRSHSDDMLVAYVTRARVVFAVDFVGQDRLGYRDLASFYFPDLFDAMAALQEIPYERIVFGHGPNGDRSSIDRQIQYYRDLDSAVRAAIDAGQSEDEAAASVLLSDYREWGGYADWRELNVRGMYRKLAG